MASIAGIVFNLEGPRALSDFREERLLRALEKVNSAVEAVSSRFIHFVHAEKELDAASVDRLHERGADDDSQHNTRPRGPAQIGGSAEAHIAAYHDDIAVREVQHFCNAVNHRVAECDDGVDAAQTDAADQMIQKAHGLEHLKSLFLLFMKWGSGSAMVKPPPHPITFGG